MLCYLIAMQQSKFFFDLANDNHGFLGLGRGLYNTYSHCMNAQCEIKAYGLFEGRGVGV